MKQANYNEESVCPLCGSSDIEWDFQTFNDNYREQNASCNNCGATWTEFFKIVFAGTDNIYDKDGNKYEEKREE